MHFCWSVCCASRSFIFFVAFLHAFGFQVCITRGRSSFTLFPLPFSLLSGHVLHFNGNVQLQWLQRTRFVLVDFCIARLSGAVINGCHNVFVVRSFVRSLVPMCLRWFDRSFICFCLFIRLFRCSLVLVRFFLLCRSGRYCFVVLCHFVNVFRL